MKILPQHYLLAAMIIALAACTDKQQPNTSKEEGTFTSAVQPLEAVQQKVTLISTVPEEILGLQFEGGGKCAIDAVNAPQPGQVITINKADGMNVRGWAFDDVSGTVPSVLVLQLVSGDQRYYADLSRQGARPDLAQVFGKSEYSGAGYAASIDSSILPSGRYDILVIQKSGKTNLVCSTYRKLDING